MSRSPKIRDRVASLTARDGTLLEQRANGVRVTFPDGSATLVLNAILAPETMQNILLASVKPALVRA